MQKYENYSASYHIVDRVELNNEGKEINEICSLASIATGIPCLYVCQYLLKKYPENKMLQKNLDVLKLFYGRIFT